MAGTIERSQLYVEGKDDSHAIRHLLIRHGIDYDQKPWPTSFPSIDDIEGKDTLLKVVKTAVSLSNGRSVGFVLDANASLQSRWNEIASRLRDVDLHLPREIPAEGFVGESTRYRARVGYGLCQIIRERAHWNTFSRPSLRKRICYFHTPKNRRDRRKDWVPGTPIPIPPKPYCTPGSRGRMIRACLISKYLLQKYIYNAYISSPSRTFLCMTSPLPSNPK